MHVYQGHACLHTKCELSLTIIQIVYREMGLNQTDSIYEIRYSRLIVTFSIAQSLF